MANDYTAWPIWDDVAPHVQALGVDLERKIANPHTYYSQVIGAVAAEIETETKRQFVASTEVRLFSGSGTPVQNIDEVIDVSAVQVAGSPVTDVAMEQQHGYPCTTLVWTSSFPEGRDNVEVEGTWGYGATIPVDLWVAAAEEAAARIAADAIFDPEGNVVSWSQGNVSEKRSSCRPGDAAGIHQRFRAAIRRYTKPVSTYLAGVRKEMV